MAKQLYTEEDGSCLLAEPGLYNCTHSHWSTTITWSVDDGQTFVAPVLQDNTDYYESMTLSQGDHTLVYQDTMEMDGMAGMGGLPGELDIGSAAGVAALAGGPDADWLIWWHNFFTLGSRSNVVP